MDVSIDFLMFQAAGPEVDNLNLGASRMCKENVLGLQVAVNDLMGFQQDQTTKKLLSKAADQLERKSAEVVTLDELVEIHAQKFSRDAQMTSEIKTLCEADHAMLVLRVLKVEG